jgi:hypothetical protein
MQVSADLHTCYRVWRFLSAGQFIDEYSKKLSLQAVVRNVHSGVQVCHSIILLGLMHRLLVEL